MEQEKCHIIVHEQDVAWIASRLGNLKESICVDDPEFTHGDLIWSQQVDRLLYDPIVQLLNAIPLQANHSLI